MWTIAVLSFVVSVIVLVRAQPPIQQVPTSHSKRPEAVMTSHVSEASRLCPYCTYCQYAKLCTTPCTSFLCSFCRYVNHCDTTCKTTCQGACQSKVCYTNQVCVETAPGVAECKCSPGATHWNGPCKFRKALCRHECV